MTQPKINNTDFDYEFVNFLDESPGRMVFMPTQAVMKKLIKRAT
jgi:hypothetical protein